MMFLFLTLLEMLLNELSKLPKADTVIARRKKKV
jgi:hypothetical protein